VQFEQRAHDAPGLVRRVFEGHLGLAEALQLAHLGGLAVVEPKALLALGHRRVGPADRPGDVARPRQPALHRGAVGPAPQAGGHVVEQHAQVVAHPAQRLRRLLDVRGRGDQGVDEHADEGTDRGVL